MLKLFNKQNMIVGQKISIKLAFLPAERGRSSQRFHVDILSDKAKIDCRFASVEFRHASFDRYDGFPYFEGLSSVLHAAISTQVNQLSAGRNASDKKDFISW